MENSSNRQLDVLGNAYGLNRSSLKNNYLSINGFPKAENQSMSICYAIYRY